MPTALVYELALNRAEAADFAGATSLFHNRFFGREEGGTNVRQVWIEVKLLQIQSLSNNDHCKEALAESAAIAKPVAGLAFTQNGLDPFLNSARTKYLLADAPNSCGQKSEASAKFTEIAADTEHSNLSGPTSCKTSPRLRRREVDRAPHLRHPPSRAASAAQQLQSHLDIRRRHSPPSRRTNRIRPRRTPRRPSSPRQPHVPSLHPHSVVRITSPLIPHQFITYRSYDGVTSPRKSTPAVRWL